MAGPPAEDTDGFMANEQTVAAGGVGLPDGEQVGKYVIQGRVGMGGQAIVYRAHDPLLDRDVAIKQISSHLAAEEKFLERFRKEAQILAKLGSEQEAIVTIHDLIEEERGLFIVMEYLEGNSLETVLNNTNGPSEAKAVLQIMWRLAAALHAVHRAGIIHRDLKPSNIIICEGLRAKITDFGVAATMSGDASMPLGTTKYMAPELYEDLSKVDGRADMYSLGMICYELLAGRPKFDEIFADIVRDKHGEQLRWMKWHGNQLVEAPPLEEVSETVPPVLSDIVEKMMAKNPDERFQSMEELGRAIKTTFSPRAKGGARRPVARRRRPAAAAALTASDSGPHLVPRDEGDELDVAPEGAATAPLPSTGLGRKLLLYFALPVLILMVVGAAAGGIYHLMRQRARQRQTAETAAKAYKAATTDLKAGLASYDLEKFESAAKGYQKVLDRYPSSVPAVMATVMQPISAAYVAMGEGDWEKARQMEDVARERVKKIEATRADLYRWAKIAKDYIRNFTSYYIATRTFREAMGKARTAFDARQYDEARLVLRREMRNVSPTPLQQQEVKDFIAKVDLTEFRERLTLEIQRADGFVKQIKFMEAEEAYQRAQDLLESEEASILPAEEAKRLGQSIAGKLAQLTSNRTLNDAVRAVEKARASGDKRALLLALQGLQRIQPSDQVKDEILTIRSEMALDQGRRLEAAGQIEQARKQYEASVSLKDNPEARDAIARLDSMDKHAGLVSAGDAHFAAARWAEALAEYQKAAKLKVTDSLQAKMIECEFRIKLVTADKLRAAKDYDGAAKAYMEARARKPAAAALIQARIVAMTADRSYEKLMEDGRAALKREQWGKARDHFEQAQKIRNTGEVKDAIAETRYQENMAQGREAVDRGDYKGALGYFKVAKGFKDTEEIQELIKQAEEKLKGG